VDLSYFGHASVNDLWIDTGTSWYNLTNATTNLTCGLTMPRTLNNVMMRLQQVDVMGFHTGMRLSEWSSADNVRVWLCSVGYEMAASSSLNSAQHMFYFWCPTGILVSASCILHISDLGFEDCTDTRPGGAIYNWSKPVWSLYEETNYASGEITLYGISAGGGSVPLKRPLRMGSHLRVNNMREEFGWGPVQIGGIPNEVNYCLPGLYRYLATNSPGPYLSLICETNGIYFINPHPNFSQIWGHIGQNGSSGNGAGLTNISASNSITAGTIGTNLLSASAYAALVGGGTNGGTGDAVLGATQTWTGVNQFSNDTRMASLTVTGILSLAQVEVGSMILSNGIAYSQLPWIPTNSIPASSPGITNYVLVNLSNTVGGTIAGPCFIATNYTAAGSFFILKPTTTLTTWP